jgi:hypothetical protein
LDGVVFRVASTDYTWEDVLDWGRRQGEWSDHVREVREGVAALALVSDQGEPLDEGEVRAAAAAFRRRHRLISAEDTERWLAERHLSVAGWMDHIRRSLAREGGPGQFAGLDLDATASDDEPARLWATGVCSGRYAGFAAALAERTAAAEAQAERAAAAEAGTQAGTQSETGDVAGEETDRWDALEAAHAAFTSAATTDRAVAEEVVSRRSDWLDLELEWVSFSEEATAREALLCVREDGDFSAALSVAPGTAVPARRRAHLCDFEPELRPALLCARVGDVLGPSRTVEGWRVTRVVARKMPAEHDEEVLGLAGAAVRARAVRREVERRVRWHERH